MVGGPCSPSYLEGWGGRIAWAQEVEVAVSCDCTTVLQAGQQSEALSQHTNKQTNRKKQSTLNWIIIHINNEKVLLTGLEVMLTGLEVEQWEIRLLQVQHLGDCFENGAFLLRASLHGRKAQETSSSLFYKDTNLIHGTGALKTQPSPKCSISQCYPIGN